MTQQLDLPTTTSSSEQEDAAAKLIRTNRRRLKIRRIIAFASIPVILVAVAFTGKLLSMYAFAHFAITSHVSGDAEGTVRSATGQLPLNWFESYKAPYNIGVGLAAGTKLPQARAQFEAALPLAPGLEACPVHENLTLVIEAMGDEAAAAQDDKLARSLWTEALDHVVSAPEGCRTEEADQASTDPNRSMQDELDETERRIREKLNPPEGGGGSDSEDPNGGGEEGEQESEDQPSEDKLGEIQDKLDEGQQERDDLNGGDGEGEGGGGAEKPW